MRVDSPHAFPPAGGDAAGIEGSSGLVARIDAHAARRPDTPAIETEAGAVSYAALGDRSRALAARIEAACAGAYGTVAVRARRGSGFVVAMLAALRAGRPFLLVDADLPDARREAMLEDAAALVSVDVAAAESGRTESPPAVVRLDRDPAEAARRLTPTLPVAIPGDVAAYVVFTSGTTGRPKGVLGSLAGLTHFVDWQRTRFAVHPGDRVAQVTNLSFDVLLREVFLPLTAGATLVVPPSPSSFAGSRVLPWLATARITRLHAVPTLTRSWLAATPEPPVLPDLRTIFFAGEPLDRTLAHTVRGLAGPDLTIVNLYGPTETTLAKCCAVIGPDAPDGVQPVGRPMPGCRAEIIDADGRPVPDGDIGEIALVTAYRSLGYLSGTAPQAGGFAPGESEPAAIPYRTGDLGAWRDGLLRVLGRKDDQVKIGGVRIEPKEVASVLAAHPDLAGAAVVAFDRGVLEIGPAGEKILCAFVVPHGPADATLEHRLRTFMAERLPAAMLPASYTRVSALPTTRNGKLDRAALPTPILPGAGEADRSDLEIGSQPVAPEEAPVLAVLRRALGERRVRLDDPPLASGATSLELLTAVAELETTLGIEITVGALFRAPDWRTALSASRSAGHVEPIPPAPEGDVAEASPQQARFDAVYRRGGDRTWCTIAMRVDLPPACDAARLARALRAVMRRHDALTATFFRDPDGRLMQRFHAPVLDARSIEEIDARALHRDEAEAAAKAALDAAAADVIPADRFPLVRARLVRGADHATALVGVHHLVFDGQSREIFERDLTAAVTATSDPWDLPAAQRYRDFAAWQNRLHREGAVEPARRHWARVFAGRPLPSRLALAPVAPDAGSAAAKLSLPIAPTLARGIAALAAREAVTEFTIVVAAYARLVARLTGREEALVGTPMGGRRHPDLRDAVGNFIGLVPLRLPAGADTDFATLARETQRTVADAVDAQDWQFHWLTEDLGIEEPADTFPLTTTFFSRLDLSIATCPEAPTYTVLPTEVLYEMMGYLRGAGETMSIDFYLQRRLFDEARARRTGSLYLEILAAGLDEAGVR